MKTFRVALLLSATLFTSPLVRATIGEQTLPFEPHRGHLVVVQGLVKGFDPLKLVIDTGASHSVLDKRVVHRLGLKPSVQSSELEAFGRRTVATRVLLPGVRLGTHLTSLLCWVQDLSNLNVDGILGLDVLMRQPLTIDYQRRIVQFGTSNNLPNEVSLEPHPRLIVVKLKVNGEARRLSIDTGIPWILLYRDRCPRKTQRANGSIRFVHVTGPITCPEVWLGRLQVGTVSYSDLYAYLLPRASSPEGRDGNLGPQALDWVRVHFDFGRRVLEWEE